MIIALPIITSGCATLLNGDTTELQVITLPTLATVRIQGDSVTHYSREAITIPRADSDLIITVTADSLRRTIALKPHFSNNYLYGNLLSDGIGYLVDIGTSRKYRYDDVVYVNLIDTSNGYPTITEEPPVKGSLRPGFVLSILVSPTYQVTSFRIDTGAAVITGGGIISAMASADYFYGNHSFFSVAAGAATDMLGEHFDPSWSAINIAFASVADGYDWGWGWISGGLQATYTHFGYRGDPTAEEAAAEKKDMVLGARLSGALRLSKYFHFVVNYTPGFYSSHLGFGSTSTSVTSFGLWLMLPGKAPF